MLRLVETPRARIGRMESALNAVSRRDAVPACGPRKSNTTLEFEGPFEFGNGKLKGILAQPEEAHVLDLDIVDSLFVVKLPKKGDWVDEFRGRRRLETSGLQGRSGRLQKRKGDPSKRGRGRPISALRRPPRKRPSPLPPPSPPLTLTRSFPRSRTRTARPPRSRSPPRARPF